MLEAGAAVINDISGLLYPEVAGLVAEAGAGLVIMHTRARPKLKVLDDTLYAEAEGSPPTWSASSASASTPRWPRACPRRRRSSTPGPTSPRHPAQTVEVLRDLAAVAALGRPLLLALSRKDFVGRHHGAAAPGAPGRHARRRGPRARVARA